MPGGFARSAARFRSDRCRCDTAVRRDSHITCSFGRCRSAGGCYRRYPSTCCIRASFPIACFLPVLFAAEWSRLSPRTLRIRNDALLLEPAPVQFRASTRKTKPSSTAQPSRNRCSPVRVSLLVLSLLLPLPPARPYRTEQSIC